MTDPDPHVLLRVVLDWQVPGPDGAGDLQETLSRLFWKRLAPAADRVLSRACPGPEAIRLERLELDLGTIERHRLEADAESRFVRALEDALAAALERQRPAGTSATGPAVRDRRLELLAHVLVHGSLPWWWTSGLPDGTAALIETLAALDPRPLRALLEDVGQHESVRRRLVLQHPDPTLHTVVAVLEPRDAAFIIDYAEQLQAEQEAETPVPTSASAFRDAKWELILTHLLVDRGSEFNRREFLRSTIEGLARRFRMRYEDLLAHLMRPLPVAVTGRRPPALLRLLTELWSEATAASAAATRNAHRDRVTRPDPSLPPLAPDLAPHPHKPRNAWLDILRESTRPNPPTRTLEDTPFDRAFRDLVAQPRDRRQDVWRWAATRWGPARLARHVAARVPARRLFRFLAAFGGMGSPAVPPAFLAAPRWGRPEMEAWLAAVAEMSLEGSRTPSPLPTVSAWIRRLARTFPRLRSLVRDAPDARLQALLVALAPGASTGFGSYLDRLLQAARALTKNVEHAADPDARAREIAWGVALQHAALPSRVASRATRLRRHLEAFARHAGLPRAPLVAELQRIAPELGVAAHLPDETPWIPGSKAHAAPEAAPGHHLPGLVFDVVAVRRDPGPALGVVERFLESGRLPATLSHRDLPGGPEGLLQRLLVVQRGRTRRRLRRIIRRGPTGITLAPRLSDRGWAEVIAALNPPAASTLLPLVMILIDKASPARESRSGSRLERHRLWAAALSVAASARLPRPTPVAVLAAFVEALAPGSPAERFERVRQLQRVTATSTTALPTPLARALLALGVVDRNRTAPSPPESDAWHALALWLRDGPSPQKGRDARRDPSPAARLERLLRTRPSTVAGSLRRLARDPAARRWLVGILSPRTLPAVIRAVAGAAADPILRSLRTIEIAARRSSRSRPSRRELRRFLWDHALQRWAVPSATFDPIGWLPPLSEALAHRFDLDHDTWTRARRDAGLPLPSEAAESAASRPPTRASEAVSPATIGDRPSDRETTRFLEVLPLPPALALEHWLRISPEPTRALLGRLARAPGSRRRLLRLLPHRAWSELARAVNPARAAFVTDWLDGLATVVARHVTVGSGRRRVREFVWERALSWMAAPGAPRSDDEWIQRSLAAVSARFALDREQLLEELTEQATSTQHPLAPALRSARARRVPAGGVAQSAPPTTSTGTTPAGPPTPASVPVPVPVPAIPSVPSVATLRAGDSRTVVAWSRELRRNPSAISRWLETLTDRSLLVLLRRGAPAAGSTFPAYAVAFLEPRRGPKPSASTRLAFWTRWFELIAVAGVRGWSAARLIRTHLALLARDQVGSPGSLADSILAEAAARPGPPWRHLVSLLTSASRPPARERAAQRGKAPKQHPESQRPHPRPARTHLTARLRNWRVFLHSPRALDRARLIELWHAAAHDEPAIYQEFLREKPLCAHSAFVGVATGGFDAILRILTGNTLGRRAELVAWILALESTPSIRIWLPFDFRHFRPRLLLALQHLLRRPHRRTVGAPWLVLEILRHWGVWPRAVARAGELAGHLGAPDLARPFLRTEVPAASGLARLLHELLAALPPAQRPPGWNRLQHLAEPPRVIDTSTDTRAPVKPGSTVNRPRREPTRAPEYPRHRQTDEPIFVANAGLPLVAPFFPTYFRLCELLADGKFKSPEAAERAVHLTQYLVTPEAGAFEHTLALNKVLCGLPLELPIAARIELTPQERQAGNALLTNAIRHWGKVTLSNEGFRNSYLWRPGKLARDPNGWRITLERRAYDLLLASIPWSFTVIKASYMPEPLFVDWI